jgi:GTP cyclohydrolase IIa
VKLEVKLTLVELRGYRDWTELLGSDREWRIQSAQARLYEVASRASASASALAVPLRYDYILLVTTGLEETEVKEVVDEIAAAAPVSVRHASACAQRPTDAVAKAFRALRGGPADPCLGDLTVIAHVDLDDVTSLTESTDPVEAYRQVQSLLNGVSSLAFPAGGIVQYLGGDNILVIMPTEGYERLAQDLASLAKVKVGVGVARSGREASALATEALDEIRRNRSLGPVRVRTPDVLLSTRSP